MKISLDFDKTYTEDPTLWDTFVALALSRGHDVRIVTFRDPKWPIEAPAPSGIPVIYTSHIPKREFTNKAGWTVDVWIDDSPEIITQKSDWTEDDRLKWLEEKKKQDEIIFDRVLAQSKSAGARQDDERFDVV